MSIFLVQLNIELQSLSNQNDEILCEINRCESDLQKYDEKLQILDNMTQLATQSLEVYFQAVRIIHQEILLIVMLVFLRSAWKIYVPLLMNNVGLFLMVYKKKLIIGKKFMLCYNSINKYKN